MTDSTWVRTYNDKGFYVSGGTGILAAADIISNTKVAAPTITATVQLNIPVENAGVAIGNTWKLFVEI